METSWSITSGKISDILKIDKLSKLTYISYKFDLYFVWGFFFSKLIEKVKVFLHKMELVGGWWMVGWMDGWVVV